MGFEFTTLVVIGTNCIGGCFKVRNINIVLKKNSNKIPANKFICFKYNQNMFICTSKYKNKQYQIK